MDTTQMVNAVYDMSALGRICDRPIYKCISIHTHTHTHIYEYYSLPDKCLHKLYGDVLYFLCFKVELWCISSCNGCEFSARHTYETAGVYKIICGLVKKVKRILKIRRRALWRNLRVKNGMRSIWFCIIWWRVWAANGSNEMGVFWAGSVGGWRKFGGRVDRARFGATKLNSISGAHSHMR